MELSKFKFDIQFHGEDDGGSEEEVVDIPAETPEQQAMNETIDQFQQELEESKAETEELKTTLESVVEMVKGIAKALNIVESDSEDPALPEELTDLQKTIEGLEGSLASITEERDLLLGQVTEFKAQAVIALAEKIADKKVSLGDILEEAKQAEVDKLVSKDEETLNFYYEELKSRVTPVKITKVVNPGFVDNSQPGVIDKITLGEESQEDQKEKIKDPSKVFSNLLTGKRTL